MANKNHLNILKQGGVENWNNWRRVHPSIRPDLRGADFTKKDFTEADFSNAFIQGANFSKAKLQGAKFIGAEAGLGLPWQIIGGICSFFISLILGVMIPFFLYFLLYIFLNSLSVNEDSVFLLFVSAVFLSLGFILVNLGQGIGAALWFVAIATTAMLLAVSPQPVIVALAWALVLAVFLIIVVNLLVIIPVKLRFPILVTLSLIFAAFVFFRDDIFYWFFDWYVIDIFSASSALSVLTAIGVAVTVAKGGMITDWHRVMAVIIAVVMPLLCSAGIIFLYWDFEQEVGLTIGIGGFLGIILGVYIGWRVLDDDPRYVLIRNISLNLGAWGNTSFRDADLTNADFTNAKLQHVDLRGATITHTNWYKAKKFAHARVGRSYLQSPQVRKLVLGKSGNKKNFDHLDLSGIKLPQARLAGASFIGTNLTKADLQQADLSKAKLVESNLEGVNLGGATLTGACVENWRITKSTKLNGVKCDYIYLRQPNRLREPEKEGETLNFNKLSQNFIDAEEKLKSLYRTFDQLYPISDKVNLEYRLIEEARNAKISRASYRKMFEDYRRQKIENEWQKSAWKSIFAKLERQIEKLNQLVSEMDIFPILERLSQLSIVIAVILFINQLLKEKMDAQYRGWEIINTERSRIHGGTVIVLKNWNKYGGSLHGIKAQKANLKRVDLSKADLTDADFSDADLEKANLSRATLKGAKFINTNLHNAKFGIRVSVVDRLISVFDQSGTRQVQEEGANLIDADFSGANLIGADFRKAKNLNIRQIKSACFWEKAKFDSEFKEKLFSAPKQEVDCDSWDFLRLLP